MTKKCVVITADIHAGHPAALPPNGDGWDYVDGGRKENSGWQNSIWQHWEECWQNVADLRKGAELIVIDGGDCVEGRHHDIVELLTDRIDEQERMAVSAMQEGLALGRWNPKKDRLIFLSGTEAHCEKGNSSTERVARALLRTEQLDSTVVRPYIRKSINGVLFDIAHKGYRLSSREWSLQNSMRAFLTSEWFRCLKSHYTFPQHYIRAHQHTFGHATQEDDYGHTISEAWLMASWKLKDSHVYTFNPQGVSNIGLLAFTISDNGQCQAHPMLMRCIQDEIEEL